MTWTLPSSSAERVEADSVNATFPRACKKRGIQVTREESSIMVHDRDEYTGNRRIYGNSNGDQKYRWKMATTLQMKVITFNTRSLAGTWIPTTKVTAGTMENDLRYEANRRVQLQSVPAGTKFQNMETRGKSTDEEKWYQRVRTCYGESQ